MKRLEKVLAIQKVHCCPVERIESSWSGLKGVGRCWKELQLQLVLLLAAGLWAKPELAWEGAVATWAAWLLLLPQAIYSLFACS